MGPSAANIKSILSSVGIEADGAKVDKVVAELAGKNIEELIAEGTTKLGSMPSGGAAAAAPAAAAAGAPQLLLPLPRHLNQSQRRKMAIWDSDFSIKLRCSIPCCNN